MLAIFKNTTILEQFSNTRFSRYQNVFVYLFYLVLNSDFSSSSVRGFPLETIALRNPHG